MDEKTRERIYELARSFKELHLAADMNEALERAKKIVLSSDEEGKPVKELLSDVKEEVSKEEKEVDKLQQSSDFDRKHFDSLIKKELSDTSQAIDFSESSRTQVKKMFEELKKDIKEHKLEEFELKEAVEDLDKVKCASEDLKFIVDEADKIQKKKKT